MKWTGTMTTEFLKLVAEDIDEHGRATAGLIPVGQIRVGNEFFGKLGIPLNAKQVKNRYYDIKKDWEAWVLLTESQSLSGVGRDPQTGLVTGPEHWWNDMIAVLKVQEKHRTTRWRKLLQSKWRKKTGIRI